VGWFKSDFASNRRNTDALFVKLAFASSSIAFKIHFGKRRLTWV
jgi:hypothetical protein